MARGPCGRDEKGCLLCDFPSPSFRSPRPSRSQLRPPPPRRRISVFRVDDTFTIPAGDFCSFPITIHTTGKMRIAVYFNRDGTMRQISQNPSLVDTATANGVTVTRADRGLDKFTFNPDGTVFLLSTGVHFKVNGVYYELGLRKILFSGDPDDPSSTVLSFEQHGRFGDDAPAAVCPLFG
jgi:hypothetical protein